MTRLTELLHALRAWDELAPPARKLARRRARPSGQRGEAAGSEQDGGSGSGGAGGASGAGESSSGQA